MKLPVKILISILLLTFSLSAQTVNESGVLPGAFSRIGFGARGMGMGNAVSGVTVGELVSYYNPALSVFQKGNSVQVGYSFLSLDRSLNFINYTRRFKLNGRNNDADSSRYAGISAGIINAGVSNIDGRDGSGNKIGDFSTSENQFFIGLANRFSEKISIGANVKFYYFKLYEQIKANGFGIDLGILYKYNDNLTFSLVISDINSKYKWNTTPVYGEQGNTTTDKFPLSKKIGVTYKFENPKLIAALEFESLSSNLNYLKFGAEYNLFDNLFLRGGFDKLNTGNLDNPFRPSLGFSYFYNTKNWLVGFDYAFVVEPYSPYDKHIIGLNFNF